jgi:hypothetical protein
MRTSGIRFWSAVLALAALLGVSPRALAGA